jgi:hypothetical protein
MIYQSGSVLKSNTVKVVSAVVAAGAVVAMGTLTVRVGAAQAAQDPGVPQHFGGPVNTSIFAPTASLGMPMTSAANSPSAASASGGAAATPAAS